MLSGVEALKFYDQQISLALTGVGKVVGGIGGNDVLSGTAYTDSIDGGDGNDRIDGLNGDDTVHGGQDNDVLNNRSGADIFVFVAAGNANGFHIVQDFVHGTDQLLFIGSDCARRQRKEGLRTYPEAFFCP